MVEAHLRHDAAGEASVHFHHIQLDRFVVAVRRGGTDARGTRVPRRHHGADELSHHFRLIDQQRMRRDVTDDIRRRGGSTVSGGNTAVSRSALRRRVDTRTSAFAYCLLCLLLLLLLALL